MEEIDLRIESIKSELDKIHESFKHDLENIKNQLMM